MHVVINVICFFSDIRDKDEWWFSAQQKHCLCVEHPILLDKQRFAQGTLLHVTIMLTISGPINYIGESGVIYIIIFQLKASISYRDKEIGLGDKLSHVIGKVESFVEYLCSLHYNLRHIRNIQNVPSLSSQSFSNISCCGKSIIIFLGFLSVLCLKKKFCLMFFNKTSNFLHSDTRLTIT